MARCGRDPVDLPDLPALVPGLRRRRGRGPARASRARLDHLAWLGVDALWLSPIYPSPLADFGYDVSDYTGRRPGLRHARRLRRAGRGGARARAARCCMDIVPCHTSIEHPWFREHPDWYIWATTRARTTGSSAFGGSAWTPARAGAATCTRSIPSSPTSTGATPRSSRRCRTCSASGSSAARTATGSTRIDRLLKDPELRDDPPASEPFGLPLSEDEAKLGARPTRATRPTPARRSRGSARRRGDAFLVGEVYLPSAQLAALPRPLRRGLRVRAAARAAGTRDALRAAIEADARAAARARPG